ncbi:hypothetical protein J6590_021654 [Homalodisca vitripennis]|nr:hypothetical protein J6590_021654 [Homalodisca vitripennis]
MPTRSGLPRPSPENRAQSACRNRLCDVFVRPIVSTNYEQSSTKDISEDLELFHQNGVFYREERKCVPSKTRTDEEIKGELQCIFQQGKNRKEQRGSGYQPNGTRDPLYKSSKSLATGIPITGGSIPSSPHICVNNAQTDLHVLSCMRTHSDLPHDFCSHSIDCALDFEYESAVCVLYLVLSKF